MAMPMYTLKEAQTPQIHTDMDARGDAGSITHTHTHTHRVTCPTRGSEPGHVGPE